MTTDGVTGFDMESHQKTRIRISILIAILFTSNVIFYGIMWPLAYILGDEPITQTFSYILARNTTLQIVYSAWWVFYSVVNVVIFFMLLEKCMVYPHAFHPSDSFDHSKLYRQKRYVEGIWFYIFLNTLKVACLLLLFIFPDMGDTSTLHLTWAGIAFGTAIAGCWLIFFIRLIQPEWRESHARIFALVINFLANVAQFVMGILFIVTPIDNRGVYEFVLSLLIMLDTFYIFLDYFFDALDMEIIFRYARKSTED